jgi:hypothetical protein
MLPSSDLFMVDCFPLVHKPDNWLLKLMLKVSHSLSLDLTLQLDNSTFYFRKILFCSVFYNLKLNPIRVKLIVLSVWANVSNRQPVLMVKNFHIGATF